MQGKFICYKTFENVKPLNVFKRGVKNKNNDEEFLNKHILFRRKFFVSSYKSAKILITADDYFKLYINGKYVVQGPPSGYPQRYYYIEKDISEYLVEGENTLAVHTYYQGLINHVWVSGDLRATLWCELYLDDKLYLKSDESFKCTPSSFIRECGRYGYDTQFAELYDCTDNDVNFYKPEYDDGLWENACVYKNADYHLVKSLIKELELYYVKPKTVKKEGNIYFVDFGQEMVGYLSATAKGSRGDEVILRFSEELNEEGNVRYEMRCNCKYQSKWVLSGEEDTLSEFDYKAFRYVEIVAPENVDIQNIQMLVRHYPFEQKYEFNVADDELNEILKLCVNTVKFGVQEQYLDCPTREKGQYLGDLAISGRAHCILTGDTTFLKRSLLDFCESCFVDKGMLAVTGSTLNQEIADYSLLFASLCLWVYKFDKDISFLKTVEPYATGVYEYFKKYERGDGLLDSVTGKWNLVDWPKNLRDGYDFKLEPSSEVERGVHNVINAFWIGYLEALKEVYSILKIDKKLEIEGVKKSFVKAFYKEEMGLFSDNEKGTHSAVHSNVLPMLFNIGLDIKGVKENIVKLILDKKLTSMGVYFAYFTLTALIKNGYKSEAISLIKDKGAWLNMINEGATTTFEAWGKEQKWNTSLFHPWAVAPIVVLYDKEIY